MRSLGSIWERAPAARALQVGLLAVLATAWLGATPALDVSGSMDGVPLLEQVFVLEDPLGELALEDVLDDDARFALRPGDEPLDFGHTRSTFWLRFDLANPTEAPLELLLAVDYAPLDRVVLYDPTGQGGFDVRELGDHLPPEDRFLRVRGLVFPVRVEAGATERFYLRTASTSTVRLPLTLSSPNQYIEHVHDDLLYRGLFFGALAALFGYNLFLFASTRDVIYFHYSGSTAFAALFFVTQDGLLDMFFDGAMPWLGTAKYVMALAGSCFALQFGRAFLETPSAAPAWDRWLRGFLVFQLALLASYAFLPSPVALAGVAVAASGYVVILLPVAFVRMRNGYVPARMYLLAWSPVLILMVPFAGSAADAVPQSEFVSVGMRVAMLSERVLAAFALAYRINVMRRHEHELNEQARVAEKERRELESQLGQSLKLEAVGKMAGGVAHDFNNALQVVRGYHEILLENLSDDDPSRGHVLEAQHAADGAVDLTRQLLAFSRRQVLEQVDVPVNDLVDGLVRMLRPVLGEGLTLQFHATSEPAVVHVDPNQIEQVLLNLCNNARDAMDGVGTLELRTRVQHRRSDLRDAHWAKAERYVDLQVRDDGSGIPEEVLEHIFEPFFTTKGASGTGLGLASAYGVVRQHGGQLVAESKEGVGSVFHVYLPLVEPDARVG